MDREKVIKGLEKVVEVFDGIIFSPIYDMWMDATKEAIALLKAQEPVEPTIGGDADGPCRNWWYQCGKCKESIDYHDKYCRNCGRAVKWG